MTTSAKDLRDLDPKDLVEHVATTRKEVFGLRFQHATGELENTAGLRAAKRELARDAMRLAIQKLPIKAKVVTREETEGVAA